MEVHSLSSRTTISGMLTISGVHDPLSIGDSVWIAIDGTERRLDTTSLAAVHGYPMKLEAEARDAPCWIKQGDSTVTLPVIKARIQADEWRVVEAAGDHEAYFAVQRASGTVSGTLVITRIDLL